MMLHPFSVIVGCFTILTALIPNPPNTWFGEATLGVKILPWPVINSLLWGLGLGNIFMGFFVT